MRMKYETLGVVLIALTMAACSDDAPPPDVQTNSASSESVPVEVAATKQDYSDQWWFKTYGDSQILLMESALSLGLNAEALARDERLLAEFRAEQGQTYLKTTWSSSAGDQIEQIELSEPAYLALWDQVLETGFLTAAMAGENTGWGTGIGVLLHGEAGPQGLGWTITSTYEGMKSAAETRRLIEVLDAAAIEHSSLYREHR